MRDNYYLMLKPESRQQGQAFKQWCKDNRITMNRALCLIMKKVINGKIVIKQAAKEIQ